MKKSLSLFFIFLANIVILAHSAVPHHHEDVSIESCKISLHKKLSDNNKCPHNDTFKLSAEGKESGAHGLTFEECQLEYLFIRQGDIDNNPTTITQTLNLESEVFIPINILRYIFPTAQSKEETYTTYVHIPYKSFVTQTIALRAPPILIFTT